jgi:hypothetical protein
MPSTAARAFTERFWSPLLPETSADLPFLFREAPALYAPVEVRRFASPTVLWLHEAYWARQGYDVRNPSARASLERWLVDRYAVSVPSAHDPASLYVGRAKTVHADRYGGPFGLLHGGSGRTVTVGDYNAKGTGITPLCDTRTEWNHSNGALWMEEAIRETIYSLVASWEFPFGGNPVVALIDSGANYYHAPESGEGAGEKGGRRAILVRPAALRVGHFERSIYFGTSGTPQSDQFQDAVRVKQVVRSEFGALADPAAVDDRVRGMFIRVAAQMGYGRAHRLHHGDYISSNLCAGGELLDFGGGFRIVHDWTASRWRSGVGRFGQEYENLGPSVRTVLYQINKYAPVLSGLRSAQLTAEMKATTQSRFAEELRAICRAAPSDDPALGERLTSWLLEEYDRQQALVVDRNGHSCWMVGAEWIYRGLTGEEREASCAGTRIRRALEPNGGSDVNTRIRNAARARILRWAKPRIRGTRDGLGRSIWYVLHKLNYQQGPLSPDGAVVVSNLIDVAAAALRRGVPGCRESDIVLGRARLGTSFAWLTRHAITDALEARLEGICVDGELSLFGTRVPIADLDANRFLEGRDGRASLSISVDPAKLRESQLCGVSGVAVTIPPFAPRI